MPSVTRTPLVIVAGLARSAARIVADQFLHRDGAAVVSLDLADIGQGVVRRRVRHRGTDETAILELAHGCVSCTLREDVVPLLSGLARRADVAGIGLHLDPALEPESICWGLGHVCTVDDRTVLDDADILAVVTAVDIGSWLSDVESADGLVDRGLIGSAEEERKVAQVTVGQVEFADALVVAGDAPDVWRSAQTDAILDRLAPAAPRIQLESFEWEDLLARIPASARRGEVDDAHAPLLRGEPPLEPACGVSMTVFADRRPFHPGRLHDAIDVLVDGVVRTRGRAWVATQPDATLWLESCGGGVRLGRAGSWLAGLAASEWDDIDPERRALAALRWHPDFGDRAQELVVIAHRANPEEITATLGSALLTNDELAAGEGAWKSYDDPFDWPVPT